MADAASVSSPSSSAQAPPSPLEVYRRAVKERLRSADALAALDLLRPPDATPSRSGAMHAARPPPPRLPRPEGADADPATRRLEAHVLIELGQHAAALALLEALAVTERAAGGVEEETGGLLGRLFKDRALLARAAGDEAGWRAGLERSFDRYLEAYDGRADRYWTGVNAATLALLRADVARSRSLATQVLRALDQRPAPAHAEPWIAATRAECLLLLGRADEAVEAYRAARATARGGWRDLASTRRNARLVAEAAGLPWAPLDAALAMPRVAVCVGAASPVADPDALRDALRAWLREERIGFGHAGVATEAEVLFHEALAAEGGESNVLLPFAAAADGGEGPLRDRVRAILAANEERTSVVSLHRFAPGSRWEEFCDVYLEGLARDRARRLTTDVVRLAIGGDGAAAPPSMVARWRRAGLPFARVDASRPALASAPANAAELAASGGDAAVGGGDGDVVTLLFADAVGFSRLTEAEIARFTDAFLPAIAGVVRDFHPLVSETWGDGLFCAFPDVREAGAFALRLRDEVGRRDWSGEGLPRDLSLRIGLHTGPVRRSTNPVTGRASVMGTQINHAARIEPIAEAGQALASEAFAATAAASGATDFECVYVGRWEWAKGYAVLPTYRLEWHRPR